MHLPKPFLLRIIGPFSLLLSSFFPTLAQKPITLKSPNGQLTFTFQLTKEAPTYRVEYKGTEMILFLRLYPYSPKHLVSNLIR